MILLVMEKINQSYSKELMQFSNYSSIILLFQMKSVVELVDETSRSESLRMKQGLGLESSPLVSPPHTTPNTDTTVQHQQKGACSLAFQIY